MAGDDASYWKAKCELLQEQFNLQKKRNEELEDRLLDMVEKIEADKLQLSQEIDGLTRKLENASKQTLSSYSTTIADSQATAKNEQEPEDPVIKHNTDLKPIRLGGKTSNCEGRGFLDFPVLSMDDGFIYGFRWTKGSVVKVV